ncbi:tetratricopeptide repeat protein [Klebsiella quasipneumoniae]|uniref:tetratricopeptide repeat protein n=1 Tax=Klebsiella quasipneumoniae TaxID=1463165 RepID=UPI00191ECAFE|nr:tetratricopeptide repeat protein [Klebsiella quasipneumoniae]
MYKLLESRIKQLEKLKDPSHTRIASLALFRIIMQHACVSLGEWIVFVLRKDNSKMSSYTAIDIKIFLQPADGSLVSLLTQLLVSAENLGWRSVGKKFWEKKDLTEDLRKLTGDTRANMEKILLSYVKIRNEGGEGHGLPGGYIPSQDISLVKELLNTVSHILPAAQNDSERLYLPHVGTKESVELKTLRLINKNPICYRRLNLINSSKLLVNYQVQESLLNRSEGSYEVENILLNLPRPATPQYDVAELTWTDNWTPFIHIPDRLATLNVFTGRESEIRQLIDWADDADSRKCMVWGDGGVGKTTLVVEFLHRLLEGKTPVEWRPDIITFYTAKKTRWGLNGLEQISAQDIGVADVALDIARMLTSPNLEKSWFDKSPREVIQKLSGLLAEMKVKRNSHLIILDNTETMAWSDADIQALATQINDLSRHIGRVILTSRRREHIEALPIQTENWKDNEGAEFLRKRARDLNCATILQAGDSTLKRYSRSLINKPIALEVFAQAASSHGTSLDSAFQRVQRMQRQDLGQFLYDDAWARLSPELRHVLLLMSRIGDIHDQYLMQLCCQKANVSVAAASEAIEESRGIGNISRYEGTMQVTFSSEFYNYCIERTEQIDGKKLPAEDDVAWVKRRYAEFIVSASSQVHDRHARAFRVPSARAAWKSFQEGRIDVAIEYYEAALLEDPDNGWLYDRFAYALMKFKNFDPALEKAKRAIALLPDDPEAIFTKGMIEARIGLLDEALQSLQEASRKGKPLHLCEMQKAYAYVYSDKNDIGEAAKCIDRAKKDASKDKLSSKFNVEISRFEKRWLS